MTRIFQLMYILLHTILLITLGELLRNDTNVVISNVICEKSVRARNQVYLAMFFDKRSLIFNALIRGNPRHPRSISAIMGLKILLPCTAACADVKAAHLLRIPHQ